jgi:hypothetical protein
MLVTRTTKKVKTVKMVKTVNYGTKKIFPILPWGFFLEEEDSHGDHGLDSLVELRFKTPPGTSYSYTTIQLIGTT